MAGKIRFVKWWIKKKGHLLSHFVLSLLWTGVTTVQTIYSKFLYIIVSYDFFCPLRVCVWVMGLFQQFEAIAQPKHKRMMIKETWKLLIDYQFYWFIHFFSQATRRIIKTSVQFAVQQDTLGACLQTEITSWFGHFQWRYSTESIM